MSRLIALVYITSDQSALRERIQRELGNEQCFDHVFLVRRRRTRSTKLRDASYILAFPAIFFIDLSTSTWYAVL